MAYGMTPNVTETADKFNVPRRHPVFPFARAPIPKISMRAVRQPTGSASFTSPAGSSVPKGHMHTHRLDSQQTNSSQSVPIESRSPLDGRALTVRELLHCPPFLLVLIWVAGAWRSSPAFTERSLARIVPEIATLLDYHKNKIPIVVILGHNASIIPSGLSMEYAYSVLGFFDVIAAKVRLIFLHSCVLVSLSYPYSQRFWKRRRRTMVAPLTKSTGNLSSRIQHPTKDLVITPNRRGG
jgi:hypothetical protein